MRPVSSSHTWTIPKCPPTLARPTGENPALGEGSGRFAANVYRAARRLALRSAARSAFFSRAWP